MTQSVSCLWTNFGLVPASYDSRCVCARRATQRGVGGRLTAARVQVVAELLTSFQTVQRGEQTTRWKLCNAARDYYPGVGKQGAHGLTLVSFVCVAQRRGGGAPTYLLNARRAFELAQRKGL